MDDLDRMYRLLVRNVRTIAPDYLARPFELAELYQNLIPYRHHRRELGIDTNEDYELALTRLLAGERGYLVTEPEVQRSLLQVLGSSNPEPAAFPAEQQGVPDHRDRGEREPLDRVGQVGR